MSRELLAGADKGPGAVRTMGAAPAQAECDDQSRGAADRGLRRVCEAVWNWSKRAAERKAVLLAERRRKDQRG